MAHTQYEESGGFSLAKIMLSGVLPPAAFTPEGEASKDGKPPDRPERTKETK